jgi:hypothetical protein
MSCEAETKRDARSVIARVARTFSVIRSYRSMSDESGKLLVPGSVTAGTAEGQPARCREEVEVLC